MKTKESTSPRRRAAWATATIAAAAVLACTAGWLATSAVVQPTQASATVLLDTTDDENISYVLTTDGKLTVDTRAADCDFVTYSWWRPDRQATSVSVNPYADLVTSVVFKGGVEAIGSYAFMGCTSLASITIPDTCIVINPYAFKGCTSLTELDTANVRWLDEHAFQGCTSLEKAKTDASTIGKAAFKNCTALREVILTSLTFGNSTDFGSVFKGCTSLERVQMRPGACYVSDGTKGGVYEGGAIDTTDIASAVGHDVEVTAKSTKRIKLSLAKRTRHKARVKWSKAHLTPQKVDYVLARAGVSQARVNYYVVTLATRSGKVVKTRRVYRERTGSKLYNKQFKIRRACTFKHLKAHKGYLVSVEAYNGGILTGSSTQALKVRKYRK